MFKQEFKYYKSKKPPPDYNDVLDFNKEINPKQAKAINVGHKNKCFGLKPAEEWKVYEITSHPGLIFIKNPFTSAGQLYFTIRCLQDYSRKPNKSNIDAQGFLMEDEDWWNKSKVDANLLNKMRWVTFGYHHDWDTKVYNENNKSPFPKDLHVLNQYIANILNIEYFKPEAAIVNYYHIDSTLSGHTDHSEENLEAPLFSFSFGQSAIFLIGGKSIEEKPLAIFIHSGDVIIMSKYSRLCYHGVPKIMSNCPEVWQYNEADITTEGVPDEFEREIIDEMKKESYRNDFECYLRKCRVNINVRQVLYRGQKSLCNNN